MLILEREREERNQNHGFWKQRCRGCLAASPYCSKTTMLRRKASRDLICTSPIYRSKFPSKKKKNKIRVCAFRTGNYDVTRREAVCMRVCVWGFGSAQRERETMNSSSSGSAPQQQLETTQFLLLTSPSRLISSNTLAISGDAPTLKEKKNRMSL